MCHCILGPQICIKYLNLFVLSICSSVSPRISAEWRRVVRPAARPAALDVTTHWSPMHQPAARPAGEQLRVDPVWFHFLANMPTTCDRWTWHVAESSRCCARSTRQPSGAKLGVYPLATRVGVVLRFLKPDRLDPRLIQSTCKSRLGFAIQPVDPKDKKTEAPMILRDPDRPDTCIWSRSSLIFWMDVLPPIPTERVVGFVLYVTFLSNNKYRLGSICSSLKQRQRQRSMAGLTCRIRKVPGLLLIRGACDHE